MAVPRPRPVPVLPDVGPRLARPLIVPRHVVAPGEGDFVVDLRGGVRLSELAGRARVVVVAAEPLDAAAAAERLAALGCVDVAWVGP